jgi:hypothetical protein
MNDNTLWRLQNSSRLLNSSAIEKQIDSTITQQPVVKEAEKAI